MSDKLREVPVEEEDGVKPETEEESDHHQLLHWQDHGHVVRLRLRELTRPHQILKISSPRLESFAKMLQQTLNFKENLWLKMC